MNLLDKAADLIAKEGWLRGGTPPLFDGGTAASCHSADTAIFLVARTGHSRASTISRLFNYLVHIDEIEPDAGRSPSEEVAAWNDNTTKVNVLRRLREAAKWNAS